MPYFETGTQVSFDQYAETSMFEEAAQGQHIGAVSSQGKPVDISTTFMALVKANLLQFDAAHLLGIKNAIEINTKNEVEYLRVSWNIDNDVVTDFVIGAVCYVSSGGVSADEIRRGCRAVGWVGQLLTAGASTWQGYIIREQSGEVNFQYDQTVKAFTSEILTEQAVLDFFGTLENATAQLKAHFESQLKPRFEEAYAAQGVTVNVISYEVISADTKILIAPIGGGFTGRAAQFFITFRVKFETVMALQASPLLPLVIIAIGAALALIVAAVFVPPALFDWLKSMTTSTVQSEKWDWVYNPNTGEYEWKKVSDETTVNPDAGGIFALDFGIIAIVVVVLAALFGGLWFFGRRR